MEQLCWLKGYSRRLERSLTCPLDQRRRFLAEAHRMAEDFLQGNPDATPEEVQEYLGPPRKLAHTFLETLDSEELRHYRAKRRNMKRAVVALAIIVFLSLGGLTAFLLSRPMTVQVTDILIIHETRERP